LYTFDITSPGGDKLCEGYKILSEDCINGRDVKTITLVDEYEMQLSDSIFAYLMNHSKILDTTSNTLANQVQLTSTRVAPNLESIQNALKYDKKLFHPSTSEFEKVCSLMDKYEIEGTIISKQYGVKGAQDPKEQAVLLGVASTIMPILLNKYPDFLAVDSTGRRNSLNFLNTAFMVRSNEPRGRIVAIFVSDKETISVVDLMFESVKIDQDTWNVFRFGTNIDTQYIEMEDISEENFESEISTSIDGYNKTLCVTSESAASSSLESYLRQKDANGHNKNELKLPERRGPKNKRKSRLVPGESIQLRDTILNIPYYTVKIVEIIGESRVIVNITFENGSQNQRIVQLDDIIGYADEQDSHGNIVVFTIPFGGKKGTLYLTSTCPVDTSLILIQSVFTHQDIYNQATAFVLADSNSYTHLLYQVLDHMEKKKWVEAKFF
ncbi:13176_t:CDS:2, partial [Racocetra fulgida]